MWSQLDTVLHGANIDFIDDLYRKFENDPSSVDSTWAHFFRTGELPASPTRQVTANTVGPAPVGMALQAKVDQTVTAFRLRGHLVANIDPLGLPRASLEHIADYGLVKSNHFDAAELATTVDGASAFETSGVVLDRLIERMRKTYTRSIGVEFLHMQNSERRRWLMQRMESTENETAWTIEQRRRMLKKLCEAEAFESTIHTKFQAAKRFSIEGGEALLPMLDRMLETGAELGINEVVIGMAHRGRLNVLANILGKPAELIFSEFLGPEDPAQYLARGDVKYHLGYSRDWTTESGKRVHLTMAFNPSHLGIVHPVVEGRAMAKQDRAGELGAHAILPVVVHGDAAFCGQGLVAETLNLGGIPGYNTGGTLHIVVNNQLGYTTLPDQGRTPLYCTGMAQLLDIPVFHVNGEDIEACAHVMKLATEYRQQFHTDVVIDLVCYRKYGHNEGDEPAFTQPKMYEIIRAKSTVRQLYSETLVKRGLLSEADATAAHQAELAFFAEAHGRVKSKNQFSEPSHLLGVWAPYRGGPDAQTPEVDTAIEFERLQRILGALAETPAGFTLHKGVAGVLERRKPMVRGEAPLDWAAGELLAYGTLLDEGFSLRLTGQDTERGTFSHRHAVIHDQATGRTAMPLSQFATKKNRAVIINSPLSEMGCMGFEFGYSLDAPDTLTLWEAQFGDFCNNAQVVIDQFLASTEDKWRRLTGLTLLLPHGYEGAGPEHSSARLERFLELCANDNLQVAYPTTSSQIFHLLRRQMRRALRKPLVVMTPKSLLRLGDAASPVSEFTMGRFRKVIGETSAKVEANKVKRLLVCSGKVYFDLANARDKAGITDVAIARAELIYPFPREELTVFLRSYPNAKEVVWVQEEPRNNGAWRFMLEQLGTLLQSVKPGVQLSYAGRIEAASPATGYSKTHEIEQKSLVAAALGMQQASAAA